MNHKIMKNAPALDNQLCYAIYSTGIAIQRLYKPILDQLGLTYSQYLVMNILWREDKLTVKTISERLALESSTLTPVLKRLEISGFILRKRNPDNERQMIIGLTEPGRLLQKHSGCLVQSLQRASGQSTEKLAVLNRSIRTLRDKLYTHLDNWQRPD